MQRTILVLLVACLFFAVSASGDELPKRVPGLWEEKVVDRLTPGQAQTHRVCVDEQLSDFIKQFRGGQGNCTKPDVHKQGSGYNVDVVCKQEDMTTRTHAVITGDLRQAYKAEVSINYEPPLRGRKEARLLTEARHLGACPTGMRGGDVIAADGTTFNFYDLQKGSSPR
jgi:hypothetical protein